MALYWGRSMPANEKTSLGHVVTLWLDRVICEAERKLSTARKMLGIEDCPYTRAEHAYSRNSLATVKWIRSRVPKVWFKEPAEGTVSKLQAIASMSMTTLPRACDVPTPVEILAAQDDANLNDVVRKVNESTQQSQRAARRGMFDLGGEG